MWCIELLIIVFMASTRCIFCAIRDGIQAASRVYEDEHILAFMDIRPIRPGQLLVVPRQHIDHFCDLPDELTLQIMKFGQRAARTMRTLFAPRRVGMIVHGFGVPHAHLVVLPLHHVWDITSASNSYMADGHIRFAWEQVPLAPRSELDALAAQIAAQLTT